MCALVCPRVHVGMQRPFFCVFLFVNLTPSPPLYALQATHAAVRKQKEEEEAMQADELGFKKCVVLLRRKPPPPPPLPTPALCQAAVQSHLPP